MSRLVIALLALLVAPTASAQSVREPYLQSATETSISVVWRTATATPTRVCFGTSLASLDAAAGSGASETRHQVRITGLTAGTRYYYATDAASCPAAGRADAYFTTAPARGSETAFRAWIVGDSGTGGSRQAQVTDAMLADVGALPPDLFLHMGDMAYDRGTESEFDSRFFAMYREVLRHTVVWPTIGNHEGSSSSSTTQSGPYYEAYVLPGDGSAGGLASGTEAYYAFDWANVHFIVLDSHGSPRSRTGAMLRWLEEDLAATDARWIIAYFHHPPYTHGSHDSDVEGQHIDMRQNAIPILEAHGVDLVLGGHSQIYERSWLARGAYDTPTTAAGHIVDMGDGRTDGDGAYRSGAAGAVYVVAGHGGASVSGDADHPLMYFSEVAHGSCVLDVRGDVLELHNVRWDGAVTDHFTLVKGDGIVVESPRAGANVLAGSSVDIAWSATGSTTAVRIESSLDGGATWSVIVERTEDDGVHAWTTPRRVSDRVMVRVTDADDASVSGTSGVFSLTNVSREVVVPFGSGWQHSEDGTDHGDAWRMGEGAAWPEGTAELGYGEGDEATVIADETPNVPTVYFRRRFSLSGAVTAATLRTLFDDGIAVWINGRQVMARDVDAGVAHDLWATGGSDDNERVDVELDLSGESPFVVGENWIAAIVKQRDATSSDLSFDLELEVSIEGEPIEPEPDGGVIDADGSTSSGDGGSTASADGGPAGGEGAGCGCAAAGSRREGAGAALALLAMIGVALRRRRARG